MPNIKNYQTQLIPTFVEVSPGLPGTTTIDGSESILAETSGSTTFNIPLSTPRLNEFTGYYQLTEDNIGSNIYTNIGATGTVYFYLPPAKNKLFGTFHRVAPFQIILVPYRSDIIHEGAPGEGMIINSRCLMTIQTLDYGDWDISLCGPSPSLSYGSFTYGFGV